MDEYGTRSSCTDYWEFQTPVYGDTTYTVSSSNVSYRTCEYRVLWLDWNGSILKNSGLVSEGTIPTYDEIVPPIIDEIDGTTYEFVGWDKEIVPVTEAVTYTAQYNPEVVRKYTVTWKNYDGTIIKQIRVPEGESTPEYSESIPTKESTAEFDYIFIGWNKETELNPPPYPADITFHANFQPVKRTYTVTFKNYDGSVLATETVEYGEVPEYTGATPTKEATAEFTYEFDGWDQEVSAVTGDATYTAVYTEEIRTYQVTWLNNNDILYTQQYSYGETPTYNSMTFGEPTRESDGTYSYTFIGWSPDISPVTENVIYTAKYQVTPLAKYTVMWKDYDGTILEEDQNVVEGTMPTYNGLTPTRESDGTYSYTFAGWDKIVTPVTGNVVYTAKYAKSSI